MGQFLSNSVADFAPKQCMMFDVLVQNFPLGYSHENGNIWAEERMSLTTIILNVKRIVDWKPGLSYLLQLTWFHFETIMQPTLLSQ